MQLFEIITVPSACFRMTASKWKVSRNGSADWSPLGTRNGIRLINRYARLLPQLDLRPPYPHASTSMVSISSPRMEGRECLIFLENSWPPHFISTECVHKCASNFKEDRSVLETRWWSRRGSPAERDRFIARLLPTTTPVIFAVNFPYENARKCGSTKRYRLSLS